MHVHLCQAMVHGFAVFSMPDHQIATTDPKEMLVNRLKSGLGSLCASSLLLAGAASAQGSSGAGLLAIVTNPDPQSQFMAYTLIGSSGVSPEAIRILLCGPAGDAALRDTVDSSSARFGPNAATVQSQIETLVNRGATVEVCAIYLPSRGADASVLIEGVGVASPTEIGPLMVAPDVRVLTF